MMARFGLLRRGPVFLSGGPDSIGLVKNAVILPASFRVVAFSVQRYWWRKPRWFSSAAILSLTSDRIVLTPENELLTGAALAGATKLKGKPVHTASGVQLGRVRDFAFSADTGEVVELNVVSHWLRECVIERAAVVRVELSRIIVQDSVVTVADPKVALKSLQPRI